VSSATQFYIATLLIYIGVDIIASWALNLQYGVTGILNFGFIIFQAAGAYTAAVLTLGPATPTGFQQYFGGAHLPFPLPILAAAVVGGGLSLIVGSVTLPRIRPDYQAMVLLVVALMASTIVTNASGVLNGANGLSLVPKPLAVMLRLNPYGVHYEWVFVGVVAVVCGAVYFVIHRITGSPLGRVLRAIRDDERSVEALGRNTTALKMVALIVGGALAAVSGALLVEFISAWSPASWTFPETFSFFAAVIVGGSGNNLGVMVGAIVIPVGSIEASRFVPHFGSPALIGSLQWIVAAGILLVFLWFWPAGLIPERKRHFRRLSEPRRAPGDEGSSVEQASE
jgi:ABC-type branched-subunit amino acid transport system permease subunit